MGGRFEGVTPGGVCWCSRCDWGFLFAKDIWIGAGRWGILTSAVAMFLKKRKKVSCGDTKKHKHDHQFERLVVRVLVIDAFKGAGLLLGIRGRWWSRSNVGHGVAVLENFAPPDHYMFTFKRVSKDKNQYCIGTCRWEVGQDNGTLTCHTWYQHVEQLKGNQYELAGNVIVPMRPTELWTVCETVQSFST